jgi:hypothetical protein
MVLAFFTRHGWGEQDGLLERGRDICDDDYCLFVLSVLSLPCLRVAAETRGEKALMFGCSFDGPATAEHAARSETSHPVETKTDVS